MVRLIVERRSKGHLFVTQDRLTKAVYTVRRVYLDIANAGKDDGLPTSMLREISYHRSLDHPNITKLVGVQITGSCVQL
jgi:hypothetical protein